MHGLEHQALFVLACSDWSGDGAKQFSPVITHYAGALMSARGEMRGVHGTRAKERCDREGQSDGYSRLQTMSRMARVLAAAASCPRVPLGFIPIVACTRSGTRVEAWRMW